MIVSAVAKTVADDRKYTIAIQLTIPGPGYRA